MGLVKTDEYQSQTSGAIYSGYLDKDGVRQAYGVQVWPDGGKYEGEWIDG